MPLSLIVTGVVPSEPVEEIVMTPGPEDLDLIREAICQGELENVIKHPTYLGGPVALLSAPLLRERLGSEEAQALIDQISCEDCKNALDSIATLAQDRRAVLLCRYEVPMRKTRGRARAA